MATKPSTPVEALTVDHDVPLPAHRASPGNKWTALFAQLKPRSSIGCDPGEVGKLQNALRIHLEKTGKANKLMVRSTIRHTDGRGRVWMWPRDAK